MISIPTKPAGCAKHYLLFVALTTLLPAVRAGEDLYVADLQAQAQNLQIWQKPEWVNLLHYNGKGEQPDKYDSDVNDEHFFIASEGKTNPEDELLATIAAFFRTGITGDEHAQCRFKARLNWIKQNLSIDVNSLPLVHCSKYLEWRKHVNAGSVTMVFPAYHLNSPSSMYGHTLLRLDATEDEDNSTWLSTAVSFGADVASDDNSILYAYKGLAGGYPGTFVTDHYYKKIQEYDRIEHRDIWEYKLNLTSDETERLVTHLWEVQNIRFDYYYFDENCSYRLLELLEIARPGIDLTGEFKLTAIPVDTVRAIARANMIETTEFKPSQLSVLREKLKQVPKEDHDLIIRLSEDISVSTQDSFTGLSLNRQKAIVDIAYQYLRYLQTGKERDPLVAKRSHRLLLLLNSYPKNSSINAVVDTPVAPEKGHGSKRASFGLGKRLDNYYTELGFKMSFHDLEDNEDGFLRGAQINIGSMQIRAEENESIRLYRLDLVDIFSITPRTRFFKPLSWKIYTGLERQLTRGVDQLAAHVTGGAGGSWQLLKNSQVYALVTARLEANKQLDRAIEPAIGFSSGILQHFGSSTVRLDVSGERFSDGIYRLRAAYRQNFVISTNHSIRFSAKYEWQEADEFSDVRLNYQYYF